MKTLLLLLFGAVFSSCKGDAFGDPTFDAPPMGKGYDAADSAAYFERTATYYMHKATNAFSGITQSKYIYTAQEFQAKAEKTKKRLTPQDNE